MSFQFILIGLILWLYQLAGIPLYLAQFATCWVLIGLGDVLFTKIKERGKTADFNKGG